MKSFMCPNVSGNNVNFAMFVGFPPNFRMVIISVIKNRPELKGKLKQHAETNVLIGILAGN